ncbi:conserved Plasmodium protein, unknown function [Plasmodium berghei]|uniref:Uncharacterized protein n=2 Tax=Plasmodium berghei TaxID=5821 RepID=A0A509ASM5_PLABA|nr:conserved Plasmodium protein, unknown function [Plasmodium berghei ANKA]CXJ25003.1 conserved Plasmodium protein, unknown function [Plasmodium berghei]SCM26833.1 conserved Plasmodium protein, unknown function [Plasmodium berghei]SCN28661.1 conserved Plasmodium protein, unknown function [Plasmodium berghei]SCO62879.1 conserved Plasmodium protein, unknown function [Plasmodium berghei]SCO64409.1 conserved Plasmodium protein, unknown function [Plasmodium berghei]|eukprot:XP_034424306.1 conserved Plasmodium protein, unknown function [Plasmodium berghei ANKA]
MKNSLLSQILTEAEIIELGLNDSLMSNCSSPFILNKKHYIQFSILYLVNIFFFFCVYITIIVFRIIAYKPEFTTDISLIIYVYIFIFFYIDLIISNDIKYSLVRKYNIKEVKKRIYAKYLSYKKKHNNQNISNFNSNNNNQANEKKRFINDKLFSKEKHFIICGSEQNEASINENINDDEDKYYILDELKNVNHNLNKELLKYIQFENNNYTITHRKFDIFLIIAGIINQLNTFCDLVFLFSIYNHSKVLFFISLFIYIYYLVYFILILKFAVNVSFTLIELYRKPLYRSYKKFIKKSQKIISYIKKFILYIKKIIYKCIKKYLKFIIFIRGNTVVPTESMPNLFLNKYTCYNSWVFFYKENTNTSNDLQILKLIYDTDFEDIPKKKLKKNEMKTKSMNIPLVEKNNIKFIFKRKEKTDYEKALAPKYVQMVADMSSILSFYHILNIMKSKFLSAHNLYSHISFTLIFFIWKLLYMDIILFLLKFYILFYSSDKLIIEIILFISLANMVISYIINLVDNNLLNYANFN